MPEITIEKRVAQVRESIRRVEHATHQWRLSLCDPSKTEEYRRECQVRLQHAEQEFAWHWRNVKYIFDEKAI